MSKIMFSQVFVSSKQENSKSTLGHLPPYLIYIFIPVDPIDDWLNPNL